MPNKFPKTSSDFFKAEDTSGDQAHRDVYIENLLILNITKA